MSCSVLIKGQGQGQGQKCRAYQDTERAARQRPLCQTCQQNTAATNPIPYKGWNGLYSGLARTPSSVKELDVTVLHHEAATFQSRDARSRSEARDFAFILLKSFNFAADVIAEISCTFAFRKYVRTKIFYWIFHVPVWKLCSFSIISCFVAENSVCVLFRLVNDKFHQNYWRELNCVALESTCHLVLLNKEWPLFRALRRKRQSQSIKIIMLRNNFFYVINFFPSS